MQASEEVYESRTDEKGMKLKLSIDLKMIASESLQLVDLEKSFGLEKEEIEHE